MNEMGSSDGVTSVLMIGIYERDDLDSSVGSYEEYKYGHLDGSLYDISLGREDINWMSSSDRYEDGQTWCLTWDISGKRR